MDIDPRRLIRHIEACNNAVVPGARARLRIGGAEVGWMAASPPALPDRAAFDAYVGGLQAEGAFQARGELFDVRDEASGQVVAQVDRGAIPLLGIRAEGVHMNGLVRRSDGLHLWVGRRAMDKKLDPDKLDHLTAGGIPAGHDAWSTLVKEAGEEASLTPEMVRPALPVGSLSYAMEREGGLRRDRLYCFDLTLPDGLVPTPNDDEVVSFALWRLADVAARVAETDDFKFNVNLVLIDLFVRSGLIDRHSALGRPVDEALQALRV